MHSYIEQCIRTGTDSKYNYQPFLSTFEQPFLMIYYIDSVFQVISFCKLKRGFFLTNITAFGCEFQLKKSKYEQTKCLFHTIVNSSKHLTCLFAYPSTCYAICIYTHLYEWSIDPTVSTDVTDPSANHREGAVGDISFLYVCKHLHNIHIFMFCLYNYFFSQTNIFPLSSKAHTQGSTYTCTYTATIQFVVLDPSPGIA